MATTQTTAGQSVKADANVIGDALREAFYAGLIAFGMFVLIIGMKTDQNIHNELIIVPRWGLLITVVAIVTIGRFVFAASTTPGAAAPPRRRSLRSSAMPSRPSSSAISCASALPRCSCFRCS
jgi:branched-chain amino acid transport system permease protein